MRNILSLLLCLLLLTGCAAPEMAGEGYTFTDDTGAEVTVTQKPETVAVLLSSLADLWIATMLLTFPITFFTGFWLQKNVSFSDSPLTTGTKLFRYALTVAGSLLLNYVGLKFFVEWCHIYPTPSQIITSLISVVYSYFAQRYYTFKKAI